MEYYSSREKRPQDYLKSIDLGRCDDLVAPVHLSRRVNVIKLTIKDGVKVRHYLLECETAKEMNQWVQSLVEVLGFMPGELSSTSVHYSAIPASELQEQYVCVYSQQRSVGWEAFHCNNITPCTSDAMGSGVFGTDTETNSGTPPSPLH